MELMEYTEFQTYLKEEVQKRLGKGFHVFVKEIPKNNGVRLRGLIIHREGCDVSPTIYLEEFFSLYRTGKTTEKILTELLRLYEEAKRNEDFSLDFFTDFEKVRKKIAFKLIHAEKNKKILKKIPFMPFLDLAIVFYCKIQEEPIGNGSILLQNEHLLRWGVQTEELYRTALKNTPLLLPYTLRPMGHILKEFIDVQDDLPMYVLSNAEGTQGAAAIVYPDVLRDFADLRGEDIYVLPSSVHEVILLSKSSAPEAARLEAMVREVNGTQVCPEEVLSDSVYLFRRDTGRLAIADGTSAGIAGIDCGTKTCISGGGMV